MMVALPPQALLYRYFDDHYTDCFMVTQPGDVTLSRFVQAFYTTWLFSLERFILKWLVSKPSSDEDLEKLVSGDSLAFAAWSVEDRVPDQLLMCDFRNATRSWFMVEAEENHTQLYFGSAVIRKEGKMDSRFGILLGLHKLYSRMLLSAASGKLRR